MQFPHKDIRLSARSYKGQRSYFVTICCENRQRILANPPIAVELIEVLRKHAIGHKFAIRAYCVMPDHFHMLASGLEPTSDLLAFVKNFKPTTSREYRASCGGTLWQKKFHDHILRPADKSIRVAGYIWRNPVRAGLCADPREYAHSGSFVMDWKKFISPMESWVPDWKGKAKMEMANAKDTAKAPA
jgi:putative transposase